VTALLVALGAAVGAPVRYLTDQAVRACTNSVFPWGTLTVNVAGSLLVGVVAGLADASRLGRPAAAGLALGFCGALTTFSTFGYETVRLLEEGARRHAVANAGANVAGSVLAASAGWAAGGALP
jgi:fluoride exporter